MGVFVDDCGAEASGPVGAFVEDCGAEASVSVGAFVDDCAAEALWPIMLSSCYKQYKYTDGTS